MYAADIFLALLSICVYIFHNIYLLNGHILPHVLNIWQPFLVVLCCDVIFLPIILIASLDIDANSFLSIRMCS